MVLSEFLIARGNYLTPPISGKRVQTENTRVYCELLRIRHKGVDAIWTTA